jgi:hypothetical protein
VLRVQVDFVFRVVQGEPDRAIGLAAVDVVNEQSLDLLSHLVVTPPIRLQGYTAA